MRWFHRVLAPVALCVALGAGSVALTGCDDLVGVVAEPTPDTDNPKQFNSGLLSLKHPGNWQAKAETQVTEGISIRTVTIESKGSLLAMVQTFEPSIPVDVAEYATNFVAGVEKEVGKAMGGMAKAKGAISAPLTDTLLGQSAEGVRIALTLTLLGQKVPSVVEVRKVERQHGTLVYLTLTANEDAAKAAPAFDQIHQSLVFSSPK